MRGRLWKTSLASDFAEECAVAARRTVDFTGNASEVALDSVGDHRATEWVWCAPLNGVDGRLWALAAE